jgi:hypothetical protein
LHILIDYRGDQSSRGLRGSALEKSSTGAGDLDELQGLSGHLSGALDFKDSYAKAFYDASPDSIASGKYDVSKLHMVLHSIYTQCSDMAAQMVRIA